MPGVDYIALFTRALDGAGLTYMVTGATAAIVYGKHLTDIKAMLEVSGELFDHPALSEWIARLGLQAEWARVS